MPSAGHFHEADFNVTAAHIKQYLYMLWEALLAQNIRDYFELRLRGATFTSSILCRSCHHVNYLEDYFFVNDKRIRVVEAEWLLTYRAAYWALRVLWD